MSISSERESVDALLREHGIKITTAKLARNTKLCAKCLPTLLDLMQSSLSIPTQALLAEAFFAGGPDRSQKRKAVQLLLTIMQQNAAQNSHRQFHQIASLVSSFTLDKGLLVDNADATHVHQIGKMVLDRRFAPEVRKQLTIALRKIGDADAIGYLRRGASDPQVAAPSLRALERLEEPAALAALCAQVMNLRVVVGKSEIEEIVSKLQHHSAYAIEKTKVNAWLQARGIRHDIEALWGKPGLCPDCASHLFELLAQPLSGRMLETVSTALFDRKPSPDLAREVVNLLLKRIKKFRPDQGNDEPFLSDIVAGEIANHIEREMVHEIGRLMFDTRLGELRSSFTQVMCKIASPEAISYLRKGVKDPEMSALALNRLAHLGVEGAHDLCLDALENPRIPGKDAIRETLSKLKRQAAAKKKRLGKLRKA